MWRIRKAVVVFPLVPVIAGDPQLRGRVAPEAHRDRRHRRARVGDPHLGHRQVEASLDDQRRGAALDRRGGEVVAVRALPADAEEEVPGSTRRLS